MGGEKPAATSCINNRSSHLRFAIVSAIALMTTTALAQEALVSYKILSPDVAFELARATLEACRSRGFQVAVAVVDRFGQPQVMLRDQFAGPHTAPTAIGKAFTAVMFRTNTTDLLSISQPGQPQAGIRNLPNVVVLGGGLLIEAAGSLLGAVGVSGAPGGAQDDECAKTGIEAVRDKLEL